MVQGKPSIYAEESRVDFPDATDALTLQLHKNFSKGSWVCWRTFTAASLNVLLLSFQAYYKGHLR
jgi:hypothetical protein